MIKLFTKHPASVNENYLEHMLSALSFFFYFVYAAFAALVHAFFPFLFVQTGSKMIKKLNQQMVISRQKDI